MLYFTGPNGYGLQTALLCFPPNIPATADYCFCNSSIYPRYSKDFLTMARDLCILACAWFVCLTNPLHKKHSVAKTESGYCLTLWREFRNMYISTVHHHIFPQILDRLHAKFWIFQCITSKSGTVAFRFSITEHSFSTALSITCWLDWRTFARSLWSLAVNGSLIWQTYTRFGRTRVRLQYFKHVCIWIFVELSKQ